MNLMFNPPIHPGEILREEYLVPLEMSAGALAKKLGVPRTRIERIVKEEIGVTVDTALRLSRAFNTTAQFWLNMQNDYDLTSAVLALPADIEAISVLPGFEDPGEAIEEEDDRSAA